MAATAQAVRKLEPAADDIMDLHSDSGLDFDDGDIDLDIDPAPLVQREDDDISLKDATTDAVLDTQTVTADQDDYMIDHEDYDEGDIQLGDAMNDDYPSADYTVTAPQEAPALVDDDLIDYSDDDDDYSRPQVQQGSPAQDIAQPDEAQDVDQAVHTETIATEAVTESAIEEDTANFEDHVAGEDDTADQTSFEEQQYAGELELQNDVEYDTDGDTGGVPLQDDEAQTNVSEHQQDEHDEQRSLETRPITINYEGNELWLFKQHDTEDSGDWLIDGTSLIHSSLSDLFQACRSSLGEDISSETELGLRFDHFHNMELFEDSTACVAVSLERLLDLYYTLHAQDSESEPDSFYMCLLSRPRFASLLADVAKHAEQGSGYSGLTSAIAAGETHFVDDYSGHSTEHEGTDWEQEEEGQDENEQAENEDEKEGQDGTLTDNDAAPEVDSAEHEDESSEKAGSNADAHSPSRDETKHESVTEPAGATPSGQQSNHGSSPAGQQNVDHGEETTQHDDLANQAAEQLANDTVDYSDDEDEEPRAGAPVDDSPSSATVQGDNPSTAEVSLQAADSTQHEEEHEAGHGDEVLTAEHEAYEQAQSEDQEGNDDLAQNEDQVDPEVNVESYPDYAQTYDQDGSYQEFQDTYPTEPDFNGLTNQDFTGYDYQDLDQQLQNDFISGDDVDGTAVGESTTAANEFAGDDDFLDLDNAAEWGTDLDSTTKVSGDNMYAHDEITAQHEEEGDGVVEQPAVAASSAADPVAASSTNLQNSSPQGQKRSIDEVGDSVGDAIDLTDTKRPRV